MNLRIERPLQALLMAALLTPVALAGSLDAPDATVCVASPSPAVSDICVGSPVKALCTEASSAATWWTHYHDGTEGASGTRQNSVVQTHIGSWANIPNADPIWKDKDTERTLLPVMFEDIFRGCGNAAGSIEVNADNSFLVVFNDQYVGHCGNINFSANTATNPLDCFTTTYTFPLVVDPTGNNHLVIYVWNHAASFSTSTPAMLQYEVTY